MSNIFDSTRTSFHLGPVLSLLCYWKYFNRNGLHWKGLRNVIWLKLLPYRDFKQKPSFSIWKISMLFQLLRVHQMEVQCTFIHFNLGKMIIFQNNFFSELETPSKKQFYNCTKRYLFSKLQNSLKMIRIEIWTSSCDHFLWIVWHLWS